MNKIMHSRLRSLLFCILLSSLVSAQIPGIIPRPQEVKLQKGKLRLDRSKELFVTTTYAPFQESLQFLAQELTLLSGIKTTCIKAGQLAMIELLHDSSLPQEGYRLRINQHKIEIEASTPAGVGYGVRTLIQWFPLKSEVKGSTIKLPTVEINDYPRFSYRGVHLDVSRHFIPVEEVKRFIEIAALHKFNYFHWHLTDDQGWRIEIKKYPRLTEVGGWRPQTIIGRNGPEYDQQPHGGFYTQDQIREIVQYAAQRNITIIPEIDLPGHMNAALAAYPELGCKGYGYQVMTTWGVSEEVLCGGSDYALYFTKDILDELIDLFPSSYIHLGGDECPKDRWRECPVCQSKIKELGLTSEANHTAENRLQAHFMGELENFLQEKGRKFIGWDEILENGISPTATLMAWRNASYAYEAAQRGNDAILTPSDYFYLNYYQSTDVTGEPLAISGTITLEKVYGFNPIPPTLSPESRKHILGVQACHWTEYIPDAATLQYMALPRLAAVAEIGWSSQEKNYPDFVGRVARLLRLYQEKGYHYGKQIFEVQPSWNRSNDLRTQHLSLSTFGKGVIRYTTDESEPTEKSDRYARPLPINRSITLKAKAFHPEGESRLLTLNFRLNRASLCPIRLLTTPYPDYAFKGAATLNNGLSGDMNFRSGEWIGYNNDDLIAELDLSSEEPITECQINSLISTPDWIFRPTEIKVYSVEANDSLRLLGSFRPEPEAKDVHQIETYAVRFPSQKAKRLRVVVTSLRSMPTWHPAKGRPAFLFIDEISVR